MHLVLYATVNIIRFRFKVKQKNIYDHKCADIICAVTLTLHYFTHPSVDNLCYDTHTV